MPGTRAPLAERLARHLKVMDSGCIEWTGVVDRRGYGRIKASPGKQVKTHRLAWTLANGPIPEGMFVCHHCDNPPCAQTDPTEGYPDGHLFLGTDADNHADMLAKGRWAMRPKTPA